MLVDGISYCKDKEFVMGMEKLLMEIDCLEMEMQYWCIVLVLSKCEQLELWVN